MSARMPTDDPHVPEMSEDHPPADGHAPPRTATAEARGPGSGGDAERAVAPRRRRPPTRRPRTTWWRRSRAGTDSRRWARESPARAVPSATRSTRWACTTRGSTPRSRWSRASPRRTRRSRRPSASSTTWSSTGMSTAPTREESTLATPAGDNAHDVAAHHEQDRVRFGLLCEYRGDSEWQVRDVTLTEALGRPVPRRDHGGERGPRARRRLPPRARRHARDRAGRPAPRGARHRLARSSTGERTDTAIVREDGAGARPRGAAARSAEPGLPEAHRLPGAGPRALSLLPAVPARARDPVHPVAATPRDSRAGARRAISTSCTGSSRRRA